jgi:hypothetical protein
LLDGGPADCGAVGEIEVWPSGVALRGEASNRPHLHWLKTVGKRRTTGMKKEMQVLYIEVVATHDGPEPCVGRSQGRRRSVGRGRAGRLLSRVNSGSGCRRFRRMRKATPLAALCESPGDPARSENPGMHEVLHAENREVLRLPADADDAPSWMVRGVADRRLVGREGNAEAVIPR